MTNEIFGWLYFRCEDVLHEGIAMSAIPVEHFVCTDNRERDNSRYVSGMGGATTVLVITFLLCIISVIFAVFLFQRRGRRTGRSGQQGRQPTPTSVAQYRAIYNQGNVQTHDEGFVGRDKDPFEI